LNGILGDEQERMLVVFGGKPYMNSQVVISGGFPARLVPTSEMALVGQRRQYFTGPEPQTLTVNLYELTTPWIKHIQPELSEEGEHHG
jgi:hypothetical protein